MSIQLDWVIVQSVAAAVVLGLTAWHLLKNLLAGFLGAAGLEQMVSRGLGKMQETLEEIAETQDVAVNQLVDINTRVNWIERSIDKYLRDTSIEDDYP